jgi:hypothetical protein
MSFRAFGTTFGIRVNDSAVLERIPAYLPLGWQPDTEPVVDFLYSLRIGGEGRRPGLRHFHLAYAGARQIARTMELDHALNSLEFDLKLMTAYLSKDFLFVHAGVVGWQNKAIVIPGRSTSGKTTLVAALVKAGATYYSDEYALFDRQGRVHPYAIPLSVRSQPQGLPQDLQGRKTPVAELGGQAGVEPLPVGLIVLTGYQPDAAWRPRKLTQARAVLAIMEHTVAARRGPEVCLPTLKQVVSGAAIVKSKRGDTSQVITPLFNLINRQQIEGEKSYATP